MTLLRPPLLAVVAGDPGGGNAMVPVIEALQAAGWPHRLYAYAESARLWRERGWPVADAAQVALGDSRAVLCASSVNAGMHELDWILAAQGAGLPCLALLDFWSNYRARFLRAGQLCLPDLIAVPDGLAHDEMVAAGFPAESLLICGQPALDKVARHGGMLTPARRSALRTACGVADGQALLLFVSQPLRLLATQLKEPPAIDEAAALRDVEAALASLGRPLALRVKPHPREDPADFAGIGAIWPDTRLAPEALAHDLLVASDMVVGIHSMLLLEACYLGCRVLSYQPGRPASDPLPSNRSGLSRRCDDPAELAAMLAGMLDAPPPAPPALDGKSAQRVLAGLAALLA
ncbi:hypothetical protein FNU76_22545 [Chitinimonas arctica]|uniref:Glycosyltransferase family 9 protein n=1 Tax=Chitinimonas arctica TaxID=2594795 RepID=A0A516SL67_9NEIS|nr:hypothetical protein [Chitinimonas arctica]QDQ28907.1 hypothetical protein FNU76_22545 [Chitinimonas arctica]